MKRVMNPRNIMSALFSFSQRTRVCPPPLSGQPPGMSIHPFISQDRPIHIPELTAHYCRPGKQQDLGNKCTTCPLWVRPCPLLCVHVCVSAYLITGSCIPPSGQLHQGHTGLFIYLPIYLYIYLSISEQRLITFQTFIKHRFPTFRHNLYGIIKEFNLAGVSLA